ncbi:MAG: hypothetical protein A3J24_06465 [Deltaproteobacteria bacterium RIFCSPLOWO2_02_FULL_53_8]|nr:MAG: hypothetical protein A3J24_06465 [Deltaproteobacteria bacterium RIFCSPLOWO2_02_FULL_53_8]
MTDGQDTRSRILIGMKDISRALNGVSEETVLKWHRESDLPIKKNGGVWTGSLDNILEWWKNFTK